MKTLPGQICVENKTTESVQLFTIKSKFAVRTLTALNDLVVADNCECLNTAAPPRHFVFLIDSSDSFNSGDSNSPGQSWFDLTKKFLVDFIKQGNISIDHLSIIRHHKIFYRSFAEYTYRMNCCSQV